jgi:hypothetical protein
MSVSGIGTARLRHHLPSSLSVEPPIAVKGALHEQLRRLG